MVPMSKKKIILFRRLLAASICVVILLLLVLFSRWVVKSARSYLAGAENDIPHYNGQPVSAEIYLNADLDRPAVPWNLMLVSEAFPLADGYVPVLDTISTRWEVDERIAKDAEKMLSDCRAEGLNPIICSAFRSVDKQGELFADHIDRNLADGLADEEAVRSAADIVAVPGASEHHTGLALDIVSYDYQLLDEGQEKTPENQWLREHCAEYGFILRYPPGKTEQTGIIYEPWHFRYVGAEAAAEIMEKGITLEEYSNVD